MQRFTGKLRDQYRLAFGSVPLDPMLAGAALGGQDRVLADYLLVVNARFALIEFKDHDKAILTESCKPLRLKLCVSLGASRLHGALARSAHYIAWGVRSQQDLGAPYGVQSVGDALVASYPDKVCSLLGCPVGDSARGELASAAFIRRFMVSRVSGATGARFQRYLELLFNLAGGAAKSEVERFEGAVCMFIPPSPENPHGWFQDVEFYGLDHLFALTLGRELELGRERERRLERDSPSRSGPER